MSKIISDREWLRDLDKRKDQADESHDEQVSSDHIKTEKTKRDETFKIVLKRTMDANKDLLLELRKH
ncbi:MAG: hypothetical protein U9N61_00165 [Euryarchaeota archaeon]|nr:hypothetical protein [Euryarchaeota archaeon]